MNTSVSDPASPGPDAARTFESLPRLSVAEVDYFCERCGYNLHGQPVRRDPATAILLMRCPECGTFHPAVGASSAARLWVARGARAMLIAWVFVAYGGITAVILAQGLVVEAAITAIEWASRGAANEERVRALTFVACGASALLGLVAAIASTIAFPHWKRWSLLIAAIAWPAMSCTGTILWMNQNAQQYPATGPIYAVYFALAFAVGGLLGAAIGPPLARLATRIVLTPRARQMLSHLWGGYAEV